MTRTRAERAAGLRGLTVLADDNARWLHGPVEQARAACVGGAAVVQLRAKHTGDRLALEWSRAIRAATSRFGVLFIVNDRFDVALAAQADGVHLGQDDLPPEALPAAVRERLLIGRSTHTLEQARAALREPVDYVAFGPVFGTDSKRSGYAARDLPVLAQIVGIVAPRPVIAIGGIDAGNVAGVAAAGVAGVAVISAVAAAADAENATRRLVRAFDTASGS